MGPENRPSGEGEQDSIFNLVKQIIVSTLEHEEGAGDAFAASVIAGFDIDIVRHAIYGGYYIHRLLAEAIVNYI